MKRTILYALVFLCVPVGILTIAIIRKEPMYQGRPSLVWFEQMKMTNGSPGLEALKRAGKDAVPMLQNALKSSERGQKYKAAWVLGQLGTNASAAVPDLIQAIDDKDIAVQCYSMKALSAIGTTREDLIPILIIKLDGTNTIISSYAANLLEAIARERKANNLSPILGNEFDYAMAFLKSPTPAVRLIGARKLATFPPNNTQATVALKSLLHDTNGWVREQTAVLLKNQSYIKTNQVNSMDATNSIQISPPK